MIEFKEGTANPPILKDTSKKYIATIEVEGKGSIVIELFAKDAPIAVSNFVNLANKGYYNNTTFHRVIANFMAQGGDPTGTGTGGPGYTFGLEITNHKHVTGALSMANTGRPNSNGSQFFICFEAQPFLDGKYSVFGQVIKGMEVVKKISLRDPQTAKLPGDKVKTITITVE
jgi:cyclophilin family peptidyl-prolyl cis-trans isomerase